MSKPIRQARLKRNERAEPGADQFWKKGDCGSINSRACRAIVAVV